MSPLKPNKRANLCVLSPFSPLMYAKTGQPKFGLFLEGNTPLVFIVVNVNSQLLQIFVHRAYGCLIAWHQYSAMYWLTCDLIIRGSSQTLLFMYQLIYEL